MQTSGSNKTMIIYNLFPTIVGPVTHWGTHLERAARMGFEWIFVNPFQTPGFSGSLYAVKDHFRFNPLLIDADDTRSAWDQMKDTIAAGCDLGLKFMADLVTNHCSIDSPLVEKHPEWFDWAEDGTVVHPGCNTHKERVIWGDLARIDHKNTIDPEGLFAFFMEWIRFLLDLGFSGFRCDAAYQVPSTFWDKIIRHTRELGTDVVFTAETLGCSVPETVDTALSGFDYIFNSVKWWDLGSDWLLEQYGLTRDVARSIGFPESHDTVRLAEEVRGNEAALKQRYFLSAFFSSGVLMPIGYEFGFQKKLHVVETRPEDWESAEIDLTDFIASVNQVKKQYALFVEDGPAKALKSSNDQVLLLWKASVRAGEEALIVLNKDIYNRQLVTLKSPISLVQSGEALIDVSPMERMSHIPDPFNYLLRPGEGRLLLSCWK